MPARGVGGWCVVDSEGERGREFIYLREGEICGLWLSRNEGCPTSEIVYTCAPIERMSVSTG